MYCNEAYVVDNEEVEDWTSSLQMLLTFVSSLTLKHPDVDVQQAAIFSAVLITLVVDSKTLLEQDNTDILVDAVVFLMNNLANGTHQPYSPPKFRPSTRSILVNCFFFASLCLSIGTALAAVLAMQWVTDYSAVTGRAGSTPEERMKRRHFRYRARIDWKMGRIIGALPIALHLSVLLFFAGLLIWMWDVHHSVFGAVLVCGVLSALFYAVTTILAVFCPSCPYRTPLANWIYILLHIVMKLLSHSTWMRPNEPKLDKEMGDGTTNSLHRSKFWRLLDDLHSCFAQRSLNLRDEIYIESPDSTLKRASLIWLSNYISISPDVYKRLLVLINGLATVSDEAPDSSVNVDVPWAKILHALGSIYMSFVQNLDLGEEDFTELASQTRCLSQAGMRGIVVSNMGSGVLRTDDPEFPVRLLHAWTASISCHTSDELRRQRFSDEVTVQDCINSMSSTPQELLKTWWELLDHEEQTCERVLPVLLDNLSLGSREKQEERLDVLLYLVSTRRLPWASTVPVSADVEWPFTPLLRRLRVIDWVDSLPKHPHQQKILRTLSVCSINYSRKIILAPHEVTRSEGAELRRMGLQGEDSRYESPEEMLYSTLTAFDKILASAENLQTKQSMWDTMIKIFYHDLMRFGISFDPKRYGEENEWALQSLQSLSSPALRLIACVTLGFKWEDKWSLGLIDEMLGNSNLGILTQVCFQDPPFINGDCTTLWSLRLRLSIYFDSYQVAAYFGKALNDMSTLKHTEQEIQATRLGVTHSGDLILALFHLNCSYPWDESFKSSPTFITDVLIGNIASIQWIDDVVVPVECIQYLVSICHDLSNEPTRLIRLLIELIRADINHEPVSRRPSNLLNLLKHAKTHLGSKELRPYAPSCHRLVAFIRESHKQFEDAWDEVISREIGFYHFSPSYEQVDRGELRTLCDEVITLLEPMGPWDGNEVDISWPRCLVRPTGTRQKPCREEYDDQKRAYNLDVDDQEQEYRSDPKDEGNIPSLIMEATEEKEVE
ncbi:hypothetical protein FRC14_005690 [Serendipita sp. 396]|nr:hypothetical protein FRC14_005690 [Serendipita sp. 396]